MMRSKPSHKPIFINKNEAIRHQNTTLSISCSAFIVRCDREYRILYLNMRSNEHKISADAFKGKHLSELVAPPLFEAMQSCIDAALAGQPREQDMIVSTSSKGNQCMHAVYLPEYDDSGNVTSVMAAVSDVTHVSSLEPSLYEREFHTLIEHSPDIIARLDCQMRHVYVNAAISGMGGPANPKEYLGKTKTDLGLPDTVIQAWDKAVQAAIDTGMEQRFNFDHLAGAEMRYFSARAVPEKTHNGQVESVLVIAYDVTERATMEKERNELLERERTARIQAETAARARDEFLAIVSHELRAPLNGIQSWAHVLENYVQISDETPLIRRSLQGIRTGVAQQVRLIEDLLDVTRMMSGKLRLIKHPTTLLPALEAAVENVRNAADAKHITLHLDFRITNEQIEGDFDRVQQIFWNLLSNAIKFTPEDGDVWFSATQTEKEVQVTVRDNGNGVSPDFLPLLFNRFSQEDTSTTRRHSGLGLGLFLVKHLVELHGGRVTAESRGEGSGTTFVVHFPLRVTNEKYLCGTPHGAGDEHMSLPSLEGLRILLVDDQEEARESLTVVLNNAGANVFAAGSAKEVLQWLSVLSADDYPEMLICDIAMPEEDGYAVLRKIRGWQTEDQSMPLQRLPALALTAFAQREDRIRALTAGFQMHVTKPVAPEELIIVIAAMMARD